MADMNKFEEMLERLINEDRQGAEELFHDIVVEKSRSIYESLLDDEESEYDFEEAEDVGGDATDDLMRDLGLEDEGEEDDSEVDMDLDVDAEGEDDEEMEDRVEDLEDALDDLRAEFEKLMADEDGEEEDSEEDEEWDDESEESDEEDSEEDEDEEQTDGEQMREYVEKVAPAKMGDSGSNTKSAVAGKNDMGGTTDNIARDDTEEGGAKVKQPKTHDAGNVNKPGAKASKSLKSQNTGHGAEKKGAGEGADNKTSTVGSKKQK